MDGVTGQRRCMRRTCVMAGEPNAPPIAVGLVRLVVFSVPFLFLLPFSVLFLFSVKNCFCVGLGLVELGFGFCE